MTEGVGLVVWLSYLRDLRTVTRKTSEYFTQRVLLTGEAFRIVIRMLRNHNLSKTVL